MKPTPRGSCVSKDSLGGVYALHLLNILLQFFCICIYLLILNALLPASNSLGFLA
jgi:hypothetical protein